jgi:2-polyprenyl-3-methyl-5-hydroxy-6-metoxy-1,4-benzoquinol methylase
MALGERPNRIGVLVVAYNAATTLTGVLDRIPAEMRPKIGEVVVSDDHSSDATYDVGLEYRRSSDLPLTIIRQPRNLGYGGNQKAGYRHLLDRGFDIVVLLHGDGQYAPESMPELVAPLERDECDAVFGSRMMVPGAARRGGMPLYKLAGNRILSAFQNAVLGLDLSEFHSGYRAYSLQALAAIPFERNSDGFNFDTQIIIQLHDAGRSIVEVPIPTYYGDEICYVNGLEYARDVAQDVLAYRLQKVGFGDGERVALSSGYPLKQDPGSSHGRIIALLGERPAGRVLDLGSATGLLAAELQRAGHEVTGVDAEEEPGVRARMHRFLRADLDHGIPPEAGDGYDVVLAADVLEHLRDPDRVVRQAVSALGPGGALVVTVPNVGHWYPRLSTATGWFHYDQRGPLDRGHVRFFSRRSLRRMLERHGLVARRFEPVGSPVELLGSGWWARVLRRLDARLVDLWPTLFAYQFLVVAEPSAQVSITTNVVPTSSRARAPAARTAHVPASAADSTSVSNGATESP